MVEVPSTPRRDTTIALPMQAFSGMNLGNAPNYQNDPLHQNSIQVAGVDDITLEFNEVVLESHEIDFAEM